MSFNSYWYIGLLVLSILLLSFTFIKKRNTQTLFLLLTMIGYGYMIETLIYNFLGSYEYNPNFIKCNTFYDNNLGAFVSNAFSLPTAAIFIATFHLNWIWMVLFSGLFVGIEWLFLTLHIYSHNWWRLEYTGLGLPVYFAVAKMFYQRILHLGKGFIHNLILFFIMGSISASAHILPIIFFSNRVYHPGWFEDWGRDSIALAAIFYLCASLYYCIVVRIHWKTKWMKYVLTGIIMYFVNLVLIAVGILHSLVWWDQPYYVCLSLFMVMLAGTVDKRLSFLD